MDEYIIVEFDKIGNGAACLSALHHIAVAHFASLGYTIIDTPEGKAVVGKNTKTGKDNFDALTTAWDILKESPDKTFYFTSPSPDHRFKDWRDYMPKGLYLGEEKPFPKEWIPSGNDV